MVHDPATLTLRAAIEEFSQHSSEGVWTELFRLARSQALADNLEITVVIKQAITAHLRT